MAPCLGKVKIYQGSVNMTLLERLDIKHPILLAPMAGVSTPQLAAEVSNQGGLGSLGLGANSVESARQQILQTKELTDKPFQINFFCHQSVELDESTNARWIKHLTPHFEKFSATPPSELKCIYPSFLDNDNFLNLCLEMKPKAVSFHFGIPHQYQIQKLKDAGILTLVSATNLAEAQAIEEAGIDIIIAQGVEAGGHRGIFNANIDASIKTSDLVQLIKQHCSLPIIAAGGIMNGAQARSIMQLGADAVQLGTAFVQCKSSNANTAYRHALFNQPLTQITSTISGRPARGLINHWHKDIDLPDRIDHAAYPYAYDLAKQLNAAASAHADFAYGAFWAGSNVAQIRELEAQDLVNQLILEMNQF
ncbi:nitronate monooxygenase [Acinetobacter gerneri]|uniref:Nitronate monooxygenase n=2 Tax=Acinetobacter gerneri TaxID=202952 RepID=A0AAW8JI98_9GAMM|nr:nitronate monooxygenase [Acinetobacter gerneri]MDQ9009467.1 nitronate monooxygenase [Acinetobacter gerneri]MDQ9013572.1 nitronate monooxygenase [Acinetobacter gerneri]MDQ9024864.1 nitronate monooxygenase [Acinetobacter gerneri]MDQ9052387.1 nitronate monooxygenase [Acinetobacter gerneri]MDQ9059888.1 nitronate monooxygenase [Acinetobacter gerneri]